MPPPLPNRTSSLVISIIDSWAVVDAVDVEPDGHEDGLAADDWTCSVGRT